MKSEHKIVEKPWGHEEILVVTKNYAMKVLVIKQDHRLSLQYHKEKEETLHCVSGKINLTYGLDEKHLKVLIMMPGDTVHVPPGLIHRMEGLEDSRVVECSTTQLSDVVRLADDYDR